LAILNGGRARTTPAPKQFVLKHYSREARHAATLDFFNFCSGKRTIVLINKLIWTQAAGGCPHPAASRRRAEHAQKLARRPPPGGRQARLLPTEAER